MEFEAYTKIRIGRRVYYPGDKVNVENLSLLERKPSSESYRGFIEGHEMFIKTINEPQRVSTLISLLSRAYERLRKKCGPCAYSIPIGILRRDENYYVLYHFIDGEPLYQANLSSLTITDRLNILLDISFILSELYRAGVIHMDLTPRNILVFHKRRIHAALIDMDDARFFNKEEVVPSKVIGGEYRIPCAKRGEIVSKVRNGEKLDGKLIHELRKMDRRRYGFIVTALTYRDFTPKALRDSFGPRGFIVHKTKFLRNVIRELEDYKNRWERIPERDKFSTVASKIAADLGLKRIFSDYESEFYRVFDPQNNVLGLELEIFKALVNGYSNANFRLDPRIIKDRVSEITKRGVIVRK